MMTPEKRVKELYARQVYYDSRLQISLNAVKGLFYYKIKLGHILPVKVLKEST